jgi:hypothetical protein
MRSRAVAFGGLAVTCLIAAIVVAALAIASARDKQRDADAAVAQARPRVGQVLASGEPFAVFRMLDRKHASTYGRLSVAELTDVGTGPAVLAGPSCQRVAYTAGVGLCLDVLGTSMNVSVLDSGMQVTRSFDLPGIPSRVRISPDGRWGGVTAFVVGHAYAMPGQFSTAATIVDMRHGKPVADLEKDFMVTNGGHVVDARDRNFWGLTFAEDGDTFYATLATGSKTWLIKGSIRARRAQTIHQNVECPSLSPDGTRIGYKKAIANNPTKWRFQVLDLATGKETTLAEKRSIDDQLAWLDDGRLLYADQERTYVINADGTGEPRPWLQRSDSATIAGAVTAAP